MSGLRRRWSALRASDSLSAAAIAMLIVIVAAPVVGFTASVLSHSVPDSLIIERLDRAIDRNTLGSADYGQAVTGRQIDYFTDCIGITIGLSDAGDASAVRSAVATPTAGGCSSAVPALLDARDTGSIEGAYDYFRYWHGYTIVTRPSIAAVGLDGARVLAAAGLLAVGAGLVRSLASRHGWLVPTVLLAPFVLTTDLAELPRSLPHAIAAIVALGAAWWAHATVSRQSTLATVVWVSAVSGAAFVYLDILTMPPGAVVLTVGCVGLAAAQRHGGSELAVRLAASWVAWWTAWVVTWIWKWAIASVVFGVGTVSDVIRFTAENRLSGSPDQFDFGFLQTTRLMFVVWRNQPLTVAVITVAVISTAVVAVRMMRRGRFDRPWDRILLAAPSVTVLLWYEVMRNHSQNHGFFTYRSLALSFGLALAAVIVQLPTRSASEASEDDVSVAPG